jgi:hypothetical protein
MAILDEMASDYYSELSMLKSPSANRISYLQAVSLSPVRNNPRSNTPSAPARRLTIISGPANEAVQIDIPVKYATHNAQNALNSSTHRVQSPQHHLTTQTQQQYHTNSISRRGSMYVSQNRTFV